MVPSLEKPFDRITSFDDLFAQAEQRVGYWVEGAILDFTEQARRELATSGLTRSEFADRIGASRPQVSRLLSGENNFTLKTMVEIGCALGCELKVRLERPVIQVWTDYTPQKRVKLVSPVAPNDDLSWNFSPCLQIEMKANSVVIEQVPTSIYEAVSSAA